MVTVSKTSTNTTAQLDGIPDMLKRTNGKGTSDIQALLDKIAELEGKLAKKTTLTLKVSEKGAVSLYGTGRFPISLYAGTWLKVLDMADDIRAFIEANKAQLSWK